MASDPFKEGATISVNQPVGSISISPSSRDVCLASKKGLYILDLANLNNAPRFVPQGGAWQIADVQWSPHPSTAHLILSTSSQKLIVWDLKAVRPLLKSFDAHSRAITDINWHFINPNLMATVSMDSGIRGWDLRCFDTPVMRLCDWGAAGTQVKWNRRQENLLATAHGKLVHIWDNRKGSLPVTTIRAHDSKIYGIDWDRVCRHKLVTCSLDRTIKFWTVPQLGGEFELKSGHHFDLTPPHLPSYTIYTHYPVWRARNLPFGQGILSLPQRGENALEMFGMDSTDPVESFEGHENVVKDFVWRMRGGDDPGFDDREFQLVTWSKDKTLRIWPISSEIEEKVGWQYGGLINVSVPRHSLHDVTFTKDPSDLSDTVAQFPTAAHPQNHLHTTSQQSLAKSDLSSAMTRGGNRIRGMGQLEWLTKVVKNVPERELSPLLSRVASMSRMSGSQLAESETNRFRSNSASPIGRSEWKSLKDEVVTVNKIYPRPKINFEKVDLVHRKLTISMQGPWANNARQAFMRIHWSFPTNYPHGSELPTFELERNPTVSSITRRAIVTTIKDMRAHHKQCLVETTGYLLGLHERQGRRRELDEESDSESERESDIKEMYDNVPELMLRKICGATFGPNGQLICFFPKQVALPHTRSLSRSPSISRQNPSPMLKAINVLSRLQNPHRRTIVRPKPRTRRLDYLEQPIGPAGSTMTIHDVSYLGHIIIPMAQAYGMSVGANLDHALQAKRADHVAIWATMKEVLIDTPSHTMLLNGVVGRACTSMRTWAEEMILERRRKLLKQLFEDLICEKDFQMLALLSCILLAKEIEQKVPPTQNVLPVHSPVVDHSAFSFPPQYPRLSPINVAPTYHSYENQFISPRTLINPTSFFGPSLSEFPSSSTIATRDFEIPKDSAIIRDKQMIVPTSELDIDGTLSTDSPLKENARYHMSSNQIQKAGNALSVSPPTVDSWREPRRGISHHNSGPISQKTSIWGTSFDLTGDEHFQSSQVGDSNPSGVVIKTAGRRIPKAMEENRESVLCEVKTDFEEHEPLTTKLLPPELLAMCETWKLAYADFLLRHNCLGIRLAINKHAFVSQAQSPYVKATPQHQKEGRKKTMSKAVIGDRSINEAMQDVSAILHKSQQKQSFGSTTNVTVCVPCSNGSIDVCGACGKSPKKPICSYCRIPIRGISMGCTLCLHKVHARCFRRYFLRPLIGFVTCPACSCTCLSQKGISNPQYIVPVLPGKPRIIQATTFG
ncbi:hypothetical protein L204_103501 [Cryptococcus depauperatus]